MNEKATPDTVEKVCLFWPQAAKKQDDVRRALSHAAPSQCVKSRFIRPQDGETPLHNVCYRDELTLELVKRVHEYNDQAYKTKNNVRPSARARARTKRSQHTSLASSTG